MSNDVFTEYLKTAPECNLKCLLQYLTQTESNANLSTQDRWKEVVSRKLIWRFVDQEYFKIGPALKSLVTLSRLSQQTLEPAMLLLSDLKRPSLQANPRMLILKSQLLTNISQLNKKFSVLQTRTDRAELLQEKAVQKTQSVRDETLFNNLMALNDSREKTKSITALNNMDYRQEFLARFGSRFCQICSYEDTFADDDFFIYCEVV